MAGEPLPESLAAEGRAMRRALAAEFAAARSGRTRVVVTLDSRFSPEGGSWKTVFIHSRTPLDHLREIAATADYTLVIAPETMRRLEHITRTVEETGTRLLGSSPEAVALAGDKAALGRWFERLGVPTPPFRVVEPVKGLPADWTYPAVLKPVDGAGAIDTYRIDDANNPPDGVRSLSSGLLQRLLTGEPMSASFLVSPERGARLLSIGGQRIEVRGGRFAYRGGAIPASCPEAESILLRAVESIPGLRGFVGVDFLWDEDRGEASLLEINPRPTTSSVGLRHLLPPGLLADAWLAGFSDPARWDDHIKRITHEIISAPVVKFDADGRITGDLGEGG